MLMININVVLEAQKKLSYTHGNIATSILEKLYCILLKTQEMSTITYSRKF